MAADAGVMIAVAGGTLPASSFLAGSQVSTFQIAKYEVTWNDWQEVRTWSAAEGRTYDLGSIGTGAAASNPVESVSWYDAVKWCNAKSEKDGLQPVYSANGGVYRSGEFGTDGSGTVLADSSKNGYRLPARAEWEWAARGGVSSKGFSYSGGNTVSDVAWYQDNADGGTKAVGTKAANELGIYDMSGNVAEWCWNEFTDSPTSLGSFSYFNGGSWADNEFVCSFNSPGLEPDPTLRLPGLRLARNAPAANNAPTGISLSASSIAENRPSGTVVGMLSTTDPDAADTSFTYSLVGGMGSTDNGLFTIDGGRLKTAASFDFETKTSYSIRVQSTDQGNLSTEKQFTIKITNVVDAPTVTAPASFTVTEDVAGNLVWPASPAVFADADSPLLLVKLSVPRGTLTTQAANGINITGDTRLKTFIGASADLNKYFSKAGNIAYTTVANDTADVSLTTFASNGKFSTSSTGTIKVTPVNDAPTVTAPALFTVTEDVAGNLVWPASPVAFADVDSPSLTVTLAVQDGTLTAATGSGVTVAGTVTARTFAGTAAALNSYFKTAGNIKYTTAPDNTVSRTLTTTVSDGTLSASKTSTISITPVNDAPTVTVPASFTVTEDVATSLFGPGSVAAFADVDSPLLTVTLAVQDGTLTAATGSGVTVAGTVTARTFAGTAAALNSYFKTAGTIKLTTAPDNTVSRTLTTTVSDGTLSASKTSTISITPVNDAPTLAAPASFTVTEDVATSLFGPGSVAAFADVDSRSLTVTLTVQDGTLTAASGSGVTVTGTDTAWTLTGSPADLTKYFSKAGNIKYTAAPDNTVSRTLTTTVSDGELSASKRSTISITPVNDRPTLTAPAWFTVTEDVAGNLFGPGSVAAFADVDSSMLTVTILVGSGTLMPTKAKNVSLAETPADGSGLKGWTVTGTPQDLNTYFSTAGNVRFTTAADDTSDVALFIVVSDDPKNPQSANFAIGTIKVTPVNDAPTATVPASFTVTEDVAGNLVWPVNPAAFADVDSPSLTVTLTVQDGTLTAATVSGVTVTGTDTSRTFAGTAAALNGYFKTAGNIKYTAAPDNTVARTLTTTISDGTLSATKTSTISISPVNDRPTLTAPALFTVTEDVATSLFGPGSVAAFADVDSSKLTVTILVGSGKLTPTKAQNISLAESPADGSGANVWSFTGTPQDLNTYFSTAGNVRFTTAADDTSDVALFIAVSDDPRNPQSANVVFSTIKVTPVNDAPTVFAPAAFTVGKNMATNLIWPVSPGAVDDVDSDSLTVTLEVADGTLTANTGWGITTGVTPIGVTLTGSPSDLNAYLRAPNNVQYTPRPDNTAVQTLTTRVSDGLLSSSASSKIVFNLAAPTLTAPASFTVTEDKAGNLTASKRNWAFADVDSSSLSVTLTVADGTLTAKPFAGITLDGPATGRVFIGTPAALSAYFNTAGNIQYTTALDNDDSRILTTTVSDGMLSSVTTSTIAITPVNDAPTVTAPASFTVTEDVADNIVWPVSPVAFADVDSPSLTVTLAVTDGTLTAATGGGVKVGVTATGRTFAGTTAALNSYFQTAGNIRYTTAANNTVSRTLTTTVSDGTLSASQTSTISITPVNDAPTVTAPASFTVTEDVSGNLGWPASPVAFADIDSPLLTVTLAVTDGTLTAATVAGVALGGTATSRTFAGTTADLNSYFKTAGNIKYTTALNNTASRTLTTTVSDGTLSASKTSTISITPVNDAPTLGVWSSSIGFFIIGTPGSISKETVVSISEEVWGFPDIPSWTFTDPDGDVLTATFTVDARYGTLSVRQLTAQEQTRKGVTINGAFVGSTLSFTGTAASLDAFFRDGNNVFYTDKVGSIAAPFRLIVAALSDGKLSSPFATTWIHA